MVPAATAHRCKWVPLHNQTNVLLVADPQLIDNHTYPGRNEMLLQLSKHSVDVYLKQNYHALVSALRPDYIVFLGDYLDNGRLLQDAYYENEYSRFKRIFDRPGYTRGINVFMDVPGNHDVGFGNGVKPAAQARFATHFGSPNRVHNLGGVEFVLLDTPSYLAEDPALHAESHLFVSLLAPPTMPRVLLSHVPFRRDTELHPCGPLRESSRFSQNAGYQYQLALDAEVSQELLAKIQPNLIFSGDDHDYCDVVHDDLAREITVKSISMAMGIRYPAVQLLSYSTQDKFIYDTHMCYLPRPYVNVVFYVIMAVATAVFLLAWNIKQRSGRYNYLILPAWDDHTDAIVMDSRESMSQKVSNFLKEQDVESAPTAPLPAYTHTYTDGRAIASKNWAKARLLLRQFARRWNLVPFLKHCALLACIVLVTYRVVVWAI